jgi:hypothetical protein
LLVRLHVLHQANAMQEAGPLDAAAASRQVQAAAAAIRCWRRLLLAVHCAFPTHPQLHYGCCADVGWKPHTVLRLQKQQALHTLLLLPLAMALQGLAAAASAAAVGCQPDGPCNAQQALRSCSCQLH